MAEEIDNDRMTPDEGEKFYQDPFGQQSEEFYERMPDTSDDGTEAMADDDATASDSMPSEGISEPGMTPADLTDSDSYEADFHETLEAPETADQLGDERLTTEAETEYADEGMADGGMATDTDNDVLGDKIREE